MKLKLKKSTVNQCYTGLLAMVPFAQADAAECAAAASADMNDQHKRAAASTALQNFNKINEALNDLLPYTSE